MVPWYPVDTLPSRTSGTTRLVPRYQPVIQVAPGAIRRRITSKLDELNTVLDAGRGGWCLSIGAYAAALLLLLVAEIRALSVAFEIPTSMHAQTDWGSKNNLLVKAPCGQTVWEFSHRHLRTVVR